MIGGIQIRVPVGRGSNGELRTAFAASGTLRPSATHHLTAVCHIQLMRESVVSVDVDEHPVWVNGRRAVVGAASTEDLRPNDRAGVGVKCRDVSVLALYKNEVLDPAGSADAGQQHRSAVRVIAP